MLGSVNLGRRLIADGVLPLHALHTLLPLLLPFLLAALVGVGLGILMGRYRWRSYLQQITAGLLQEKKISAIPDWNKALHPQFMEQARG